MFKKFIRGVLCLVMLSCVAFTVSSCDYVEFGKTSKILEKDSLMIAKEFKALQNSKQHVQYGDNHLTVAEMLMAY